MVFRRLTSSHIVSLSLSLSLHRYNTGASTMLYMLCEWSDKTFAAADKKGDKTDAEYIKQWKDRVRVNTSFAHRRALVQYVV